MRRKTFDAILTAGGAVLVVVLLVAGALLTWGANFANSQVNNQLAEQQITFPTAAELAAAKPGGHITPDMVPYLKPYAGQLMTTGAQAQAYADHYIAGHLAAMPYGGVYSKVSAASIANPKDTKLAGEVQTVFRGTTLRGLLLEAYAFSKFGGIARIASLASFGLAGVMMILAGFGVWHLRQVSEKEVLVGLKTRTAVELATV